MTIGGGTGSYTVLSGLKNLKNVSLTALVSMADDGGSTGILRKKWNVLPPGDVRQCLAALSGKEFLNHRSKILNGHKVGNIILALLQKITGDFSKGLQFASWLFNTQGRILPITKDDAELEISFSDGSTITGEGNIDRTIFQSEVKDLHYKNNTKINPEAHEAIINADYIVIVPGNLFCSILPNFIVNGFKESLSQSKAKVILIMNLTNKQGHTMNWSKADYLKIIEKYLGKQVDFILDNNEPFSALQKEHYQRDGSEGIFIKSSLQDSRVLEIPLIHDILLSQDQNDTVKRSLIRHDSQKLAEAIQKIVLKKKFIFDFDDVIFYATKRRDEHIYPKLRKMGINQSSIDKYYESSRNNLFSMKSLLDHFSLSKDAYDEVMGEIKSFRNEKLVEIIEKIGKENCYIVTYGDTEFQLDKITKIEIRHLFSEIFVVSGSKKEAVEKIAKKHEEEDVIFIDDRIRNFEDLDFVKYPNLKTILYDEKGLEKLEAEMSK